jgi:hypothetical protein
MALADLSRAPWTAVGRLDIQIQHAQRPQHGQASVLGDTSRGVCLPGDHEPVLGNLALGGPQAIERFQAGLEDHQAGVIEAPSAGVPLPELLGLRAQVRRWRVRRQRRRGDRRWDNLQCRGSSSHMLYLDSI